MTARTPKVDKPKFIVETGLTRRLIEADSVADALDLFKVEVPMRSVLLLEADAIRAHEATEQEITEFLRSRKRRPSEDQIAFELGDPVLTPAEKRSRKNVVPA